MYNVLPPIPPLTACNALPVIDIVLVEVLYVMISSTAFTFLATHNESRVLIPPLTFNAPVVVLVA